MQVVDELAQASHLTLDHGACVVLERLSLAFEPKDFDCGDDGSDRVAEFVRRQRQERR